MVVTPPPPLKSAAAIGADDRARIVVTNAAASLTGYSMTELAHLTVPDITASSDRPHTDVLWKAFLTHGQQSGEYALLRVILR